MVTSKLSYPKTESSLLTERPQSVDSKDGLASLDFGS